MLEKAILAGLYAVIGCDAVEVSRLADQLDVWIDDEGLYNAQANPLATKLAHHFSTISHPNTSRALGRPAGPAPAGQDRVSVRVQEDHPGRDHHCGRGRGADRVLSGPQVWPRAVRCRGDERPRDSVAPRITPASPQRPLPRWVAQQAASSRTRGMAGMSLAARVDRAGFPQQRRCWKESGSGGLPLTAVTISVSLAERDIAVCEVRRRGSSRSR